MRPVTPASKPPTPEAQLRALLDKLDPQQRKLVRGVRAALRKRFPAANELAYDYSHSLVISYSPTERGMDGIVAISARADGVALFFNQGPKLPDPQRLLKGSGKQTRFIPIETASRLAHPDVDALIAAAADHASTLLPAKGKGSLILKSSEKKARQHPKVSK